MNIRRQTMSLTTFNIHRVITLAVVTVVTAITFSTTANARDRAVRSDAGDIQRDGQDVRRDREDLGRDTEKLLRDVERGDARRLQRDVVRALNAGLTRPALPGAV